MSLSSRTWEEQIKRDFLPRMLQLVKLKLLFCQSNYSFLWCLFSNYCTNWWRVKFHTSTIGVVCQLDTSPNPILNQWISNPWPTSPSDWWRVWPLTRHQTLVTKNSFFSFFFFCSPIWCLEKIRSANISAHASCLVFGTISNGSLILSFIRIKSRKNIYLHVIIFRFQLKRRKKN